MVHGKVCGQEMTPKTYVLQWEWAMPSKFGHLPFWITSHQIASLQCVRYWALCGHSSLIGCLYLSGTWQGLLLWMTQKLIRICDEIGVCTQNMDIILSSVVNTVKCPMGPILKLEMTILVFCDCYLWKTLHHTIWCPKLCIELELPHYGHIPYSDCVGLKCNFLIWYN